VRITVVYRGRYYVRQALDIEHLVPLLRQYGHHVRFVYDLDTFGVTDNVIQLPRLARALSCEQRTAAEVIKTKPAMVVFSVLPSTYKWAQEVAKTLKDSTSAAIVFAGLFPSLVPERVMQDSFVDYVIQGEVEDVICSLAETISGEKGPVETGNLWYRENGEIRYTYQASPVNLDTLPMPDKELFRPYISHSYSYTTFVSRGCTYNCTYCEETCMKRIFGARYFRRKSVDTVIKELVRAKRRYGFKEVIFKDSYLSGNRKWLAELMRRYRAEVGVPFKCFCTIWGFDEQTARLLKTGGCYCIEFGLQSWNETIRRDILKRKETNRDVFKAFECCATEGLWYDVDHMFNLPYETEQDHIDGAFFYHGLRYLNRVKVHHLLYYPTAEIVAHGIAAKKLNSDAEEQLLNGCASDFYDQQDSNSEDRMLVSAYGALYKVLPIVPLWLLRRLLKGRRIMLLRRIPRPVLAFLQALAAARSRDLRFRAYLSSYPRKVAFGVRAGAGQCVARLLSLRTRPAEKVAINDSL